MIFEKNRSQQSPRPQLGMWYLISLRGCVLNFVAAGAAVAEMPETSDLDLRRDNVFLKMIPKADNVLIV